MRIFVTGPVGAGKSTFARQLAERASVPLCALDDLHWLRDPSGDRRRDPVERAALLAEVVAGPDWVVEGVQFKWADAAIAAADRIVVLDPGAWVTLVRLLRRFRFRRKSDPQGHRSRYAALAKELGWWRDYRVHERSQLAAKLAPVAGKVVRFRSGTADAAMEILRSEL